MLLNIHGNENLIHKCPGKSEQKVVTGGFLLQPLLKFMPVMYSFLIQDFLQEQCP